MRRDLGSVDILTAAFMGAVIGAILGAGGALALGMDNETRVSLTSVGMFLGMMITVLWRYRPDRSRKQRRADPDEIPNALQLIETCTHILKDDPTNLEALLQRAAAYQSEGENEKALADLETLIAHYPQSAAGHAARGKLHYVMENYSAAAADYTVAIDPHNPVAEYYTFRGNCRYQLKDNDGAAADYTAALELNPDDTDARMGRGAIATNSGALAKAVQDYTELIQRGGEYMASAYVYRAENRRRQGSFDEAFFDFAEAIKRDGRRADTYVRRAHLYDDLKRYQNAINDYSTALFLSPDNATAYLDRGLDFYRCGKYEDAIRDYTKAIELKFEDLALAYNHRGAAHVALKQYADALRDLNTAIELNPRYADAIEERGRVHEQLGDTSAAEADFTQVRLLRDTPVLEDE